MDDWEEGKQKFLELVRGIDSGCSGRDSDEADQQHVSHFVNKGTESKIHHRARGRRN